MLLICFVCQEHGCGAIYANSVVVRNRILELMPNERAVHMPVDAMFPLPPRLADLCAKGRKLSVLL
jgi:hypothetical protein